MIIDAPVKPTVRAPDLQRQKPLKLRLSDGYSWAHEFEAVGPETLRDGCFEAWVACLVERDRRTCPRQLELHVYEDVSRHWINANYGTDSAKIVVVSQPGTATAHDWNDEPWETYWLRCLRCWNACYRLNLFCRQIPKMLNNGSDGEIA